jgi:hypothetical protein
MHHTNPHDLHQNHSNHPIPYGHYLGNSWCVVPLLVDPNVSVNLNSIFIKIFFIAQALENMNVWIVFQ